MARKNDLESTGFPQKERDMEAEFALLEEKIGRLGQFCHGLREENRALREHALALEQDNLKLRQKLEGAETRITAILTKIPEESR